MSRADLRLRRIEWAALAVALLLALRVIFGDAFATFDRQLLRTTGLAEPSKYLVAAPAIALLVLWRLQRSRWIDETRPLRVTRRLMLMDAAVILLGVGAVILMAVSGR